MSDLGAALAAAPGWRFVARVDLLRTEIAERWPADAADPRVEEPVLAALELFRGPLRPTQLVVTSGATLAVGLRREDPAHEAFVVVADRGANVGLILASLRRLPGGAR